MKGLWPAVALGACVMAPAAGASGYRGLSLEQALERLETQGLAVFYSSDLVKRWMRVRSEPAATEPQALLREILAPYGLTTIAGPQGAVLLVRANTSPPAPSPLAPAGGAAPRVPTTGEITVNASRYELLRERLPPAHSLSSAELKLLPDLGDDPLRALARLPGAAAGDFTAKPNIRGGEADEILVRFDGLTLHNPFHFKDFQSLFSTIDPALVGRIEVYTGGFPAAYGDRMSGVVDITTVAPRRTPHREIALSFFNASALAAGNLNDGDWLAAARRGNLDLAFDATDPSLGRPRYVDVFGRISRQLAASTAVSGNMLLFEEALLLFDSDQEEQARADYRDRYVWLRMDHRPSPALSGHVLLAHTDLASSRLGTAQLPGVASGTLEDRRKFNITSLQTEWNLRAGEGLLWQLGAEWRDSRGHYAYSEESDFELLFLTAGAPTEPQRRRALTLRPRGVHYGAYASLRARLHPSLDAEAGLRWDRETLSGANHGRFSPRLNLVYHLGEHARVRASWGRFFQSQGIHELQIADGITTFQPPQRADHLLAQFEYRDFYGLDLRLEAYRKDYHSLRPRFENLLNTFVLLPELKPDRIRVAPQRARAQGLELTIGRIDRGPLVWWVSYSQATARDLVDGARIPRSWNQAHAFAALLSWQGPAWQFSLGGRLHSGWPTTHIELLEVEPLPLVEIGARNRHRLGQYGALDMRLARVFRFDKAGDLTVFLEVNNLLNRRNHCCVEYQIEAEGAEPFLDVERLDAMPLLPSLGFVWRF